MLSTKIDKLAIAVTFYYVEHRLCYLSKISSYFDSLADNVEVFIFTNTQEEELQKKIQDSIARFDFKFKILVPKLLGHPYLLPWSHLGFFAQLFADDFSISHFMYLEDDICVQKENIDYWLRGREELRPFGLIPSFLRYELKTNNMDPYSTDLIKQYNPYEYTRAEVSSSYVYLNLPDLYQGMYLLDRELMSEHLNGMSSNPDFGKWKIREKAAQGITFVNIPGGCQARNFVGYDMITGGIDPCCLIHHTPNNYANNPDTKFAKILVKELVYPRLKSRFVQPRLKTVDKTVARIIRYTPELFRPMLIKLLNLFVCFGT